MIAQANLKEQPNPFTRFKDSLARPRFTESVEVACQQKFLKMPGPFTIPRKAQETRPLTVLFE